MLFRDSALEAAWARLFALFSIKHFPVIPEPGPTQCGCGQSSPGEARLQEGAHSPVCAMWTKVQGLVPDLSLLYALNSTFIVHMVVHSLRVYAKPAS